MYTMINVCEKNHHGDAHILQFNNGQVYAIECGKMKVKTAEERWFAI